MSAANPSEVLRDLAKLIEHWRSLSKVHESNTLASLGYGFCADSLQEVLDTRGDDLGIAMARMSGDRAGANMLETMKGQLLLALVKRLGGEVVMPATEIDATGGHVLMMELRGQNYIFLVQRKS